ncbi:MAG: hypothetical protein E6Q24_14870 [Chitinophagaceae bacterium]|nr:MAG: hypothetical protein E6Q24_14870 [Chitinophagaceae bacterium]
MNKQSQILVRSQFDMMMDWEIGELCEEETIVLFQGLIDSGLAWKLQGMYGRCAEALIEEGYCEPRRF